MIGDSLVTQMNMHYKLLCNTSHELLFKKFHSLGNFIDFCHLTQVEFTRNLFHAYN